MPSEEEYKARRREINARYRDRHRTEINARYRQRAARPEIREQERARQRVNSAKMTPAQRLQKNLRARFGLSSQQFAAMLHEQDGQCAICSVPFDLWTKPCVDHDHATQQVRELLCQPCNAVLGFAREQPSILLRAITYLSAPCA